MSVVPGGDGDTTVARPFRRSPRCWFAVHLSEEAGDGVSADRHVNRCEQFADEPKRSALLPQLDDAFFERHQFCVTSVTAA